MDPDPPERLVLFDGTCAICDRAVQFLLDRDTRGALRYAPLQGPTAAGVRARHPELEGVDSLVWVTRTDGVERVRIRSHAIFAMLAALGGPWSAFGLLLWVPAALTDPAYRAFAAVRYRVFGRLETCRIPQPHELARFLA